MKALVLKAFVDEKDNIKREVGDEIIISKSRFDFANDYLCRYEKGPWLEEVEETPKKKKGKA